MDAQAQTELIFTCLGGMLLIASVVNRVLQWRFRKDISKVALDNLNARINAWWVMIGLIGVTLWLGPIAVTALFGLISVIALREFFALTASEPGDDLLRYVCFLVFLPAQYMLVGVRAYELFTLFIPVVSLLTLPVLAVLSGRAANFLDRIAERQWGLLICVYCVSYVPGILLLDIPGYAGGNSLLLVFLLLVAQSSDVLQYIFGKLCGKRKIAPELSPSKTVEGFVGGVAISTALGTALWWMTPYSPVAAFGMALTISLMGFVGGLVLSGIKRDRGIKDWGGLIRGHGGVLDRLDSVCFSAPVFFHLTRYFYAA